MTGIDRLEDFAQGALDYISVPIVRQLPRARVMVFVDLYRKHESWEQVNGELRRLSSQSIKTQDDERRRIARELHDYLGRHLPQTILWPFPATNNEKFLLLIQLAPLGVNLGLDSDINAEVRHKVNAV